jgi:SAM-dependent methyltransferase
MSVKDHFDVLFSREGEPTQADLNRAEFIVDHIPADVRTVLEVGSGSGVVTQAISREYAVTGLELSDVGVSKVRELGICCEQGSIAELPFGDRSFDSVITSEVLEHLDDETFAKGSDEIARVASKHVLVTVPNREWHPALRQECPKCRTICVPWTHIRTFDVDIVRTLFDSHGFVTKQVESFGPLVADYKSTLGRILMWHRGFYNYLRPGMRCPICKYEEPGPALKLPILPNLVKRPLHTWRYVLDRVTDKLAPKCPRWVLGVYTRA